MSKRYGRNQKRKARERIAALEQVVDFQFEQVKFANTRAANARLKLQQAQSDAFMIFMRNQDRLDAALREIVGGLTERLGTEIAPHAIKLMQSDGRREPLDFSVIDPLQPVSGGSYTVIKGEVPSIHYAVKVYTP